MRAAHTCLIHNPQCDCREWVWWWSMLIGRLVHLRRGTLTCCGSGKLWKVDYSLIEAGIVDTARISLNVESWLFPGHIHNVRRPHSFKAQFVPVAQRIGLGNKAAGGTGKCHLLYQYVHAIWTKLEVTILAYALCPGGFCSDR